MNEAMLISVIIPVFNAEKYIERCIQSIQNNTYKNIEIICVDDGSTDNSFGLLTAMQEEDKRLLVIKQENQGVSAARNTGMAAAKGDWIAFVDADDWVHKNYFEILSSSIQESDIVHCGFVSCSKKTEDIQQIEIKKTVVPAESGYQNYAVKSYVWGKLFRREIIGDLYFSENVKMAEDKIFVLQVLGRAKKITVLDNQLYYYFQNDNSATKIVGSDMLPAGKELLKIAKEMNNVYILHDAYTAFLAHRYLHMFCKDYKSMKHCVSKYLKDCQRLARKIMPLKKRMFLNIFVSCPLLYRCVRLAGDRTLIEWEKTQKRQKR